MDKVLAFLKANTGLTEMVQPEPVVVTTPKITSTLTPALGAGGGAGTAVEIPKWMGDGKPATRGTAVVPYKEVPRVTQVETFTYQGKQVWCITYSDATWERILDPTQAYLKSLELFPAGPPKNH